MGIFSKLFNSEPARKDLSALATNMCDALEDIRHFWFNSCLEALQQIADQGEVKNLNTHLEGKADYAIRAYQLYLVSNFLGDHSYMSPSNTKDFAAILCKQVFGAKLVECKIYWHRYNEAKEGQQLFRFCSDVAKHITGGETPLDESMLLSSRCFPVLFTVTHMSVAKTFGDEETVQKLEDNFKKVCENIAREWNDKVMPILHELYEDEKQEKP